MRKPEKCPKCGSEKVNPCFSYYVCQNCGEVINNNKEEGWGDDLHDNMCWRDCL